MKKFLCVLMALMLVFSMAAMPAFAEGVIPANDPVDFIAEYGWVIFALLIGAVVLGVAIYTFIKTPKEEQIEKLKEWLLWAVIEAEKEFGKETGAIKLRYVYDLFVTTFPWLAKILSFELFSNFVDEALVKMRELLENNAKIFDHVYNVHTIDGELAQLLLDESKQG